MRNNPRRAWRSTALVCSPGSARQRSSTSSARSGWSLVRSLTWLATDRRTYSLGSSRNTSRIGTVGPPISHGTRDPHGNRGRHPSGRQPPQVLVVGVGPATHHRERGGLVAAEKGRTANSRSRTGSARPASSSRRRGGRARPPATHSVAGQPLHMSSRTRVVASRSKAAASGKSGGITGARAAATERTRSLSSSPSSPDSAAATNRSRGNAGGAGGEAVGEQGHRGGVDLVFQRFEP